MGVLARKWTGITPLLCHLWLTGCGLVDVSAASHAASKVSFCGARFHRLARVSQFKVRRDPCSAPSNLLPLGNPLPHFSMADPVSLVASVLTIAAAASQISKAISRLRAFGEVPVRVYTVKNEVSDLEVVLRHVGHALEQETLAAETAQALQQTLTRTREHLHDLAKGLERIADACNGGKIKMIKKSHIWAREKELFQKLQEDIHSVKATLTLMVGVSNSWVISLA